MTILLLNQKTITAKELAQRFSVSTRTIYRDVEILSSSGIPVYMSNGRGGGISLLDDFSLDKTLLSDREREGLLTALKTMQAAKYPEIDAVLEKLSAVFKSSADTDWVTIHFADWSSSPNEYGRFEDIKNAIFKKHIIEFDYINSNGEKSQRRVEPERFYFRAHSWYLTAFCLSKNERRIFRLSRIKNVRILADMFERRNTVSLPDKDVQGFSKPLVHLKLLFSQNMLYRLYDEFDEKHISVLEDGRAIVEVAFPEDEWVYSFLLSFGMNVEVLEPPHIRQGVVWRLKEALMNY